MRIVWVRGIVMQRNKRRKDSGLAAKKSRVEAAEDDGEDSDGYGEGGLSWEALMDTIKVTPQPQPS